MLNIHAEKEKNDTNKLPQKRNLQGAINFYKCPKSEEE